MVKRTVSIFLVTMLLITAVLPLTASAWNAAPANSVDMSLKLIGMMNVKINQDSPLIGNVSTVPDGSELSGKTLYCYKFGSSATAFSSYWPHQMGDGPYTTEQFESYFGVDCVQECMDYNRNETAVYNLYDLGDPNSDTVKQNMSILGITDINLYYELMAQEAMITIDAIAGGGKGHETAITAYYRYSEDWRSFATANSGKQVTRQNMLDYGIAAPNENRYFFETKDSQKMIDGGDAFPGVYAESVAQYIDENESYSLPVWEDTDEDASWNIINPVPTCNIYSRWYDDFSKDSTYQYCLDKRTDKVSELYGDEYTIGEWNGVTSDPDVDNAVFAKNWEWATNDYYSTKSSGVYSTTSANKSHLGYGEYCPASVASYHNFGIPENTANTDKPSRFLTVMIRETGTVCGLDGSGHWHSVKVSSVSKASAVYFEPELNDDSVVIDYGLSVNIPLDNNDRVWTTDPLVSTAMPNIADIKITAGDRDDETGYVSGSVNGKYGTLEITSWSNQWGDGHCIATYTPKIFVNEPDVFYYKVYPVDSEHYEPLTAKVTVIPATLMYYEDNFSASDSTESSGYDSCLIYSGNWSYVDNSGNVIAHSPVNGTQSNLNGAYGYDDYYADDTGFSDGTAHQGVREDSLSYTFKGTGTDIIMRTDILDGSVKYSVVKHSINPDGTMGSDSAEATAPHTVSCRNNNGQTLYQLPVISLRYDEYAYYTVTLTAVTSRYIYIDGIRIYNPLGIKGEATADNATMDEYYDSIEKNTRFTAIYDAIYNATEATEENLGFLGMYSNWNEWYGVNKNYEGESTDFSSHLTIGPNNEVYLAPGQSLVFNYENGDLGSIVFGVETKAVTGPSTLSISIEGNASSVDTRTISTNTAMYYHYFLSNAITGSKGTIRIENSGSATLSVTNIKYSKILATTGTVDYTFTDNDGNPIPGITVSVYNKNGSIKTTAVSDENGVFRVTGLPVGEYYSVFDTGTLSSVIKRKYSVNEENFGDTAAFVLSPCNLEIGTAPAIYLTPTMKGSGSTLRLNDVMTETAPGSFALSFSFAGSSGSAGYINGNNYLKGTINLTVNPDGTVSCSASGSGKTNGKSFTMASFKNAAGLVSFDDTGISLNFEEILKRVSGYSDTNFKFTDMAQIFTNGAQTVIQAYELPKLDTAGKTGAPVTVVAGAEPSYTTTETATAVFTVLDESGNPVEGFTVTSDNGITGTTGEDGTVTLSGLLFGTRTFSFTAPNGISTPSSVTRSYNPVNPTSSDTLNVWAVNLEIGSSTACTGTPVAVVSASSVVFENVLPADAPGSYIITYHFDGTAGGSGFVQAGKTLLTGELSILVNSDGTATYSFDGTGLTGGNAFGASSGELTGVTVSGTSVTINTVTLMEKVSGKTGKNLKFTDARVFMPTGTSFGVTALEFSDAGGSYGNTAEVPVQINGVVGMLLQLTANLRNTFLRVLSFFRSLFPQI